MKLIPKEEVEIEVHDAGIRLAFVRAVDNGTKRVFIRCRYHPHVLRATFATLNPASLEDVRDQLDHKNIQMTTIYRKQNRCLAESASHEAPL